MRLDRKIDRLLENWPENIAEARQVQEKVRPKVRLEDGFRRPLTTIAGTDVGFKNKGALTRAAIVVLDAKTLEPLDQSVVEIPTCFPYIPGYLSFRELPALLQAIAGLSVKPDMFLCDGQGIAHPRRVGLASHLGVLLDLPTIGVAKSRLCGSFAEPALEKGAASELTDGDEQLGWVLRTRSGIKPLFISPGHLVSLTSSRDTVLNAAVRFRLPEPTRLADKLASLKAT